VRAVPLIPLLISTAAGAVLCFLPLFSLLGYESAAVMGAVLGLTVLLWTAHTVDVRATLSPDHPRGPLARFLALLPTNLALLLPPVLLLTLNALRVRNCDLGLGVAFFGVIPAVSVVAGQALGFGVAAAIPRRALRVPAALLVVAAQTGAFLWRLAWWPPITGHTWTIGWFAGSIYDEALALPHSLLWARLGVLVGSGLLLLVLELVWRFRARRPLGGAALATATLLAIAAALHLHRADLGIELSHDAVVDALGGRLESEHFVIHYQAGSLDSESQRLLVEDHEFRYAELAALLHQDPVQWRGRRIESFVYPGVGVQQRLMGSRGTLVARPWTHQMHIRWDGYGDHVLAHELAHLFSAPFGAGPLQLATRGGLMVDLGLVEGLAFAADQPPDELTAHQASKAMRQLGLAPDLRRIFGPAGFWTQPGRRAYTLVGSFVRWLIDTRGVDRFEQVYGRGDWQGVYGKAVEQLIGEWEDFVDEAPLSDAERALAEERYRRGSIFQKVCARTMAELQRRADRAEARRDWDAALAIRQEIQALQPKRASHALALARLRQRMGELDAAAQAVDALLAREGLAPARRVEATELAGDLSWTSNATADAAQRYDACLGDGLSEGDLRRLIVKREGARAALAEVRRRAREYLVDDEGRDRLWSVLQWEQADPDDPLARYLVGRVLLQRQLYDDAIPRLSDPPGAIPWPSIDEERRLLLAQAALHARRLDLAQESYRTLADQTGSSRVRALAAEGLDRVAFLRTGRLTSP